MSMHLCSSTSLLYVCICMYVCMCMYVCICVCTYVYIHKCKIQRNALGTLLHQSFLYCLATRSFTEPEDRLVMRNSRMPPFCTPSKPQGSLSHTYPFAWVLKIWIHVFMLAHQVFLLSESYLQHSYHYFT